MSKKKNTPSLSGFKKAEWPPILKLCLIFYAKILIKHKMAVSYRNSVFLIGLLILSIIIIPILMFICVDTLDKNKIGIISKYLMSSHYKLGGISIIQKILIKLLWMISKEVILILILKIMKISYFRNFNHKFNNQHKIIMVFLSKRIKKAFKLMIFITSSLIIT